MLLLNNQTSSLNDHSTWWGFQSLSKMMTVSADCRFRPRPPALVLSRNTKYSEAGSLNVFSSMPRSSALVVPIGGGLKKKKISVTLLQKTKHFLGLLKASHHPNVGTWNCGTQSSPPWWSWGWSSDRKAALCVWWLSAWAGYDPAAQTFLKREIGPRWGKRENVKKTTTNIHTIRQI